MAQEFIIALTEHRAVGNIFVPLLIEKDRSYFTVKKVVKLRDVKSGEVQLSDSELELLKTIENYSDENLTKKFSKKADQVNFSRIWTLICSRITLARSSINTFTSVFCF